jgi:hypothetical protein
VSVDPKAAKEKVEQESAYQEHANRIAESFSHWLDHGLMPGEPIREWRLTRAKLGG